MLEIFEIIYNENSINYHKIQINWLSNVNVSIKLLITVLL